MEILGNLWNAIGGLLLIILAIEVLPGLLKWVSRSLRYGRESKPDTRALADAYEDADWVGPYYAVIWDLRVNWAPHVGGIMRVFSAPGLNIDEDGLRRTWNPAPSQAPNPGTSVSRIHAYGGSTMMGFGVRDDWTVPSLLSKKLNDAGHRVDVVNFGQPTYTATQAFIAFTEQMATGNIADVTIFLDGLNEAITVEQNGTAGTVFNAAIRADEFNLMQPWRRAELLRHALDTIVPRTMRRVQTLEELLRPAAGNDAPFRITAEAIEPLCRDVVSHYVNTLRMIRAIADDNDTRPLFFWQPSLFSKRTLSDYEERYKNDGAPVPGLRGELFQTIYAMLKSNPIFQSLPGAVDVSGLFDDSPDAQFIDPFHLAEKGNDVLADAMLPHVIKALEAKKG
jgi:lysophospholipase L1-like esterase